MFFNIGETEIDTMLSYVSGIIGDLMPIILIILGVSVALFIFGRIVNK